MAMNFVTFNQDYSHLAVGMSPYVCRTGLFLTSRRDIKRVPDFHDGPLHQEL